MVLDQLEQHIDFIAFASGGLWALMGGGCMGVARLRDQQAWRWLGLFSFLQALHCAAEIGRYSTESAAVVAWLEPVLLSLSFVALLEFSRRIRGQLSDRPPGASVHLLALTLALAGTLNAGSYESWLWQTQGLLATSITVFSLYCLNRKYSHDTEHAIERWAHIGLAASLLLYNLCMIMLPSLRLGSGQQDTAGWLVELLAIPFALGALWAIETLYQRAHIKVLAGFGVRATQLSGLIQLGTFSLVLMLAWLAAEHAGQQRDTAMRNEVLMRTELAAGAIVDDDHTRLYWSEHDLGNPAYHRLKTLLASLASAGRHVESAWLAGYRDGESFFLVDSRAADSALHVPPAQRYDEASAAYLQGIQSRRAFVLGPVLDRHGPHIIASVPLPGSEAINIELAIDALEWVNETRAARAPMLLIAVLVGLLLLFYSYTHARDAEALARLKHSEQQNSSLVEGSPDAVQLIGPDGRFVSVNGRAVASYGLSRQQLLGTAFVDIWPEAVRPAIEALCRATLAGSAAQAEADYQRPDGRVISYRVATNPMRDNAGQVKGFVCLCVDITEHRASERALLAAKETAEAATRSKSEFLAVMSHEIRTPLGGVMGMLELLRNRPGHDADSKRYIQLAHGSAETLMHILDDILDASKVESGKLVIETVPFNFRDEMTYVLEAMRVRAESKRIELDWVFPEQMPHFVSGDPTKVKQILANLLSNAIKFTPQGEVRVEFVPLSIDDQQVLLQIHVKDTGIGIPQDVLPTLFSKFVQADASTTRKFGGTGLGLSIIKGMLERMGGSVGVESTMGSGTTFTVTIPFAIVAQSQQLADPQEAGGVEAGQELSGLRVLCAEDDAVNREYLQNLAMELGLEARFVENGREALNLLRNEKFDAVLMDNRMPVMDGFQATRAIRDAANGALDPQVYIIALTANASANYRDECLAAGMNDYLTKPLRRAELLTALQRVVRLQAMGMHGGFEFVYPEHETLQGMSEAELQAVLEEDSLVAAPPMESARATLSAKLIEVYLREAPRRIKQMRTALERRDFSALGRAAHTLKGNSHYVAAPDLARLGAKIEELADKKILDGVSALIEQIEQRFAAVESRLCADTEVMA